MRNIVVAAIAALVASAAFAQTESVTGSLLINGITVPVTVTIPTPPAGAQGPQGPQGAAGQVGPTGPQGPAGACNCSSSSSSSGGGAASGSSSSSSSSSSGGSGSSSSSSSGGTASASSSSSGGTSAAFGVAVAGKQLVTKTGAPLQLRGVNMGGLEGGAVQGAAHPWDYSNLTNGGGALPNFMAVAAWKANAVRLPLNEASWLGLTVTYSDGHTAKADPSGDYQSTVIATVKAANAAGLYVILDLHWAAPGSFAPVTQNPFMDSDHSLAFWTSVAATFKSNPAVIFEPFNEPYLFTTSNANGVFASLPTNVNQAINAGGAQASSYMTLSGVTSGSQVKASATWNIVGYQAAITAIRAAGATNVIICGGQGYDNDLTWWTSNPPKDTISPAQLVMSMHAYSTGWGYDTTGGSSQFTAAQSIAVLTGPGVPVVFTEVGDSVGAGQTGAYISKILAVADAQGWGVMAWTWNPWGGANTLIQNITSYTPTQGEGTAYQAWLANHK